MEFINEPVKMENVLRDGIAEYFLLFFFEALPVELLYRGVVQNLLHGYIDSKNEARKYLMADTYVDIKNKNNYNSVKIDADKKVKLVTPINSNNNIAYIQDFRKDYDGHNNTTNDKSVNTDHSNVANNENDLQRRVDNELDYNVFDTAVSLSFNSTVTSPVRSNKRSSKLIVSRSNKNPTLYDLEYNNSVLFEKKKDNCSNGCIWWTVFPSWWDIIPLLIASFFYAATVNIILYIVYIN